MADELAHTYLVICTWIHEDTRCILIAQLSKLDTKATYLVISYYKTCYVYRVQVSGEQTQT